MDWNLDGLKEIGRKVVGIGAPFLGRAIGGPFGGAAADILVDALGMGPEEATAENVSAALDKLTPEARARVIESQHRHKERLAEIALRHDQVEAEERIQALRQVNETMRAEAASDKWPQYSWRPFNGFTFPITVLAVYFVLPLAGAAVPDVPQWVWVGWLSILGVATWDRGKEKRARAGDVPGPGLVTGAIRAIRGE